MTERVDAPKPVSRSESSGRVPQLRGLELRGHSRLRELPAFLADLPALERLDVSFCRGLAPGRLGTLTRLRVLSLQVRPPTMLHSGLQCNLSGARLA